MAKFLCLILLALTPSILLKAYLPDRNRPNLQSRSFVTSNDKDYYGLGKEYPSVSGGFSLFDLDEFWDEFTDIKIVPIDLYQNIKDKNQTIGYLADFDQTLIYKILKDEPEKFDSTKYIQELNKEGTEYQVNSFIKFVEAKAKRMASSLGCLKSASGDFGFNSFEDDKITKIMYDKIDKVLGDIKDLSREEITFGVELLKYGMANKLNDLYDDNIKKVINERSKDVSITKSFNKFFTETTKLFKDIQKNVFEAILLVGSMKGCIEEDDANNDAGRSSDNSKEARYVYKRNKIVGINGAKGLRNDNKTQNNYSLEHGFGFGKNAVNIGTKNNIQFSYDSPYWIEKRDLILRFINNSISEPINISQFEEEHNLIIKDCIENITKLGCSYLNNYMIYNGNENYTVEESNPEKFIKKGNPFNSDIIISNDVYFVCRYGKRYILHIDSTQSKYEFIYNGKNMAVQKDEIIQGCFAAFSSGGKDDKDACRGEFTKKCGKKLDRQCKKSGLYDIMNEIPIPESKEISVCNDKKDDCLKIINKYFLSGGVVPKTSMFLSYGLLFQSLGRNKNIDIKTSYVLNDKISRDADYDTKLNSILDNYFKNGFQNLKSELYNEIDQAYAALYGK